MTWEKAIERRSIMTVSGETRMDHIAASSGPARIDAGSLSAGFWRTIIPFAKAGNLRHVYYTFGRSADVF
jgi:hypothetical protein